MDRQERQPRGIAKDRSTNKIDEAKSLASDIANDAKRQGREKLDSGKQTAADQTEKLAGVVERAGQELGNGDQHSLADYAGQLASSMRTFAENLRGRSVEELLRDCVRRRHWCYLAHNGTRGSTSWVSARPDTR